MTDPLRNNAIKIALSKIDANLGTYQGPQAQIRFMEGILAENQPPLKFTDLGKRKGRELLYTGEKLRQHLMELVRTKSGFGALPGIEIFKYGSEALMPEYLESIGYRKGASAAPPAAPDASSSPGDGTQQAIKSSSQQNGQVTSAGTDSSLSSAPSDLSEFGQDGLQKEKKRKLNAQIANEGLKLPASKKVRNGPNLEDNSLEESDSGSSKVPDTADSATSGQSVSTPQQGTKRPLENAEDSTPSSKRLCADNADPEILQRNTAASSTTLLPKDKAKQAGSSRDEIERPQEEPTSPQTHANLLYTAKTAEASSGQQEIENRASGMVPTSQTHTAVTRQSPAPIQPGTAEYESSSSAQSEVAQLKTQLETLKSINEDLSSKHEEIVAANRQMNSALDQLKSQNQEKQSLIDEMKSQYEEMLKKDAAQNTQPTKDELADKLMSWTEKELDHEKRANELGLPHLRWDATDSVETGVNANVVWPRPVQNLNYMKNVMMPSMMDQIKEAKERLEVTIAQLGHWISGENANGASTKAAVISSPEKGLEEIYKTFFGSETNKPWTIEASNMLRDPIWAFEFLSGLIGAAVHTMVLEKPLPWDTAAEWFEKLRPVAPYFNKGIERLGTDIKLDDIVWYGLRDQIESATFQNRIIMPIAKELAAKLELMLRPQLEALGMTRSREMPQAHFWSNISAQLTDIFMHALTLKGVLDMSPFEYRFEWVSSGQTFNFQLMKRPIGSPPGSTPPVAKVDTPILRCRHLGIHNWKEWFVMGQASGIVMRA